MDKITLPGACLLAVVGILPGFAQRLGIHAGLCFLLWRYFPADHGRRNPGFPPANRDPAADASVRWADEERKGDTGTAIIVIGIEFGDIAELLNFYMQT